VLQVGQLPRISVGKRQQEGLQSRIYVSSALSYRSRPVQKDSNSWSTISL